MDTPDFHVPLVGDGANASSSSRSSSLSESTPRSRIPVGKLDSFLRDVYTHFRFKGLFNIFLAKLLNLILLVFLAGLALFLVHFVNYGYLFGANDGPLIYPNPWQNVRPHWLTIAVWSLLALVFLIQAVSAVETVRAHRQVAAFYRTWLGIGQAELEYIRWDEVVERITRVGNLTRLSMSALDVVSRITRKENYMIALISKGVLDLRIPFLPRALGGGSPLVSETVEWALWLSLFSVNFGAEGIVNEHMPIEQWTAALRKRFIVVGVLSLLFSPIICVVLLVYVVLRYGEQIRSDPTSIGGRKWSPLARWKLREINEVHHLFDQRLRRAHLPAQEYVSQFPSASSLVVLAKFLTMLLGAALLTLLAFSFISTRFVFELWGLSSVFWITGLTAAVAAVRSLLPPESMAYDFETSLRSAARHTHYFPTWWAGRAHSQEVFADVTTLFQLKFVLWLRELVSVFIMPFVCLVSLPRCAEAVVAFFKSFTTYRPEVGNVCSFSLLVDTRLGDARYGGADGGGNNPHMRLADGKLEKSFLSFYANYPFWDMPPEGRNIIARLREFESRRAERKERERAHILESSAFAMFANESVIATGGLTMSEANRARVIESLTDTHMEFFLSGEVQRQEQQQQQQHLEMSALHPAPAAVIELQPPSPPVVAAAEPMVTSTALTTAAADLAAIPPLAIPPMVLRESFESDSGKMPSTPDPDLPFAGAQSPLQHPQQQPSPS